MTVPESLGEDLGFLLARASGLAVRLVNLALDEHGLRARHLTLLQLVESGDRSQREISAALGLDPSNVVNLVDELERLDLIRRTPDPRDRRARLISLTTAGADRLREAGQVADEVLAELVADLSERQQAQLRRALAAVVARGQRATTSKV